MGKCIRKRFYSSKHAKHRAFISQLIQTADQQLSLEILEQTQPTEKREGATYKRKELEIGGGDFTFAAAYCRKKTEVDYVATSKLTKEDLITHYGEKARVNLASNLFEIVIARS